MATARAPKAGARRAGTKRKERKNIPHGVASIAATFNNTIVAISDPMGNILAWSSAGRIGFKGSRKGTPFAAQVAAQNAAQLAQEHGVRTIDVKVKGPGAGRESAIRALAASGLDIKSIKDVTHSAQRLQAAQAEKGVRRSETSYGTQQLPYAERSMVERVRNKRRFSGSLF